jgi:cytochrome c oxidase cbb3-type subunit III
MSSRARVIPCAMVVAAAMAVGYAPVMVRLKADTTRGQQTPPATGQPPQPTGQPPQPTPGRGGGQGQRGAGQAGRQGGGGRRGGFTQFTRELAPQDVVVRGKSLYEANCASCHAADLRGGQNGTNLLRSGVALRDQHGELVGEEVAKHKPPLTLVTADTAAIAEYIHSVHATMGGQGSPPGRNPTGIELKVLVGDAQAGEAVFGTLCASCHSVTGDLKGVGAKFEDARALQNAWVGGSSSPFAGGRGGGGTGNPATVTLADGSKVEGSLVRKDDFIVIITQSDGTRRSFARNNGIPKVDVKDPRDAHKNMVLKLVFDDPENKKMHDITAYLWTIK